MTATLTETSNAPTLGRIVRHAGVAGQLAYSVSVTYSGEPAAVVSFTSSTYGGPVVMTWPAMPRGMFITDPARFGTFGPEWVRRFFGQES